MSVGKIFFGTLLFSSFLTNAYAGPYDEMYEQALIQSPVLRRIHEGSLVWRAQEQKELQALLEFVRTHPDNEEGLKAAVKKDLEGDRAYFSRFNKSLSGSSVEVLSQLRWNKMTLGVERALCLLEGSFDEVVCGTTLPVGYSLVPPQVNTVGDTDHIYASGRGIGFKHLLIRTAMRLANVPMTGLSQVLGFETRLSPFIQYTRLPKGFRYEGLESSPYYIEGVKERYIAVLHNGYTYGGHRWEEEKPFGPQDCSKFVAKYAGCLPFSTEDQIACYQLTEGLQFKKPGFESIVKEWEDKKAGYAAEPDVASVGQRMTPIKIFDISQVKPGLVHAERTYGDLERLLLGTAGHTSFAVGVSGQGRDAKVITMGTKRNFEDSDQDGIFVLDRRPYMSDFGKNPRAVMYFELKP